MSTISKRYVHGYSGSENERLFDQAETLTELLHKDTAYRTGERILEAGCGVGAQTITLAKNSLHAKITSIDISKDSIRSAQKLIDDNDITNVSFQIADIFDLPFAEETFDHIFVCFVLEHLPDPDAALIHLKEVLKPGGTLTVIEGDHGSAYFHPDSVYARNAIQCLIDLQSQSGGNSLIGRELYPRFNKAGFRNIKVSPRFVYADASQPAMVDGFTKKTFTAMVEGIEEKVLDEKLMDKASWERGIADLYRTAEKDGTFCYTFFKAVAIK